MGKSDRPILQVLQGETPTQTPIWLMRQAGRYLPEYRALRAEAGSFLKLCLNPAWAAEITLQPLKRFPLDAAIIFADILLIPMALGRNLDFREGEGPVLATVTADDFGQLSYDDKKMQPVYDALSLVKQDLPSGAALIGFCGAPWTVACYMIDGNSRGGFAQAKLWAAEQPQRLDQLLNILIEASAEYLSRQIAAGAEIIQIFDSWSGLLNGEAFRRFVIQPTAALVKRMKVLHPRIPIIGFPREAGDGYGAYIRETGIDAMSIDPVTDLLRAKSDWQTVKPLQGNLDPALLVTGGEEMLKAAERIMRVMGPRHIFNLGHGVVPQTPPQHVAELVEFVHGFKP